MKRLTSHGQAIRSTLAFFRVTHFILNAPVVEMSSIRLSSATMPDLLLVLQLAIEVAFGLLAVTTSVSWIRQPDRRHGYLALALGSLALLILNAPVLGGSGAGAQALTDLALVLFLLSGFSLVLFRDSFVPISANTHRWITAGIALVGAFGIAAQLPADPQHLHGP